MAFVIHYAGSRNLAKAVRLRATTGRLLLAGFGTNVRNGLKDLQYSMVYQVALVAEAYNSGALTRRVVEETI